MASNLRFNKNCHGFGSTIRGIIIETLRENFKSYDAKPVVAITQQEPYACPADRFQHSCKLPQRA